jgi:phosphoribosyl-ATP pyrophosphohydrolase/phosphoribosyl-AMP cyclohydrolase
MRDRNAPLGEADLAGLAWDKMSGLIPAIVQDASTGQVLMLAYMSRDALAATLASGFATFQSRSKGRLWQKGETSGNRLKVEGIFADCDQDSVLVNVEPEGPACHLGSIGCFSGSGPAGIGFLAELARIVSERGSSGDSESYTARLLAEGPARIAQKVGEEGVEVALASVTRDLDGCAEEIADLIYHLVVLMEAKSLGWTEVVAKLRQRRR